MSKLKLHKELEAAIERGKLEGVEARIKEANDAFESVANVLAPISDALVKAGFSETRAMKAAILFLNYGDWKND